MKDISIKVQNYKCFDSRTHSLNKINSINLLIGRNNSGKSSLIDLVEYLCNPSDMSNYGHCNNQPKFMVEQPLEEWVLKSVFNSNRSGGKIKGNHWEFGKQYIGKKVEYSIDGNRQVKIVSIDGGHPEILGYKDYIQRLSNKIRNPFEKKNFRRLSAERDINPETDNKIELKSNGIGATDIIQRFLNKTNYDSDLVEKLLLEKLNLIMEPDASFDRILVQQYENNGKWEVFLEEKIKGKIALSSSGSGIKTIILLLIFIFLLPKYEKNALDSYIFSFEELENNLHPALQRRVFKFLEEFVKDKDIILFITTHSHVPINMFNISEKSNIYHVMHDCGVSTVRKVNTYVERSGVIDDLDIRASDILQSNGVIWVEGPTDRLYINKWIEIWSRGKLKEGVHYQCVFYGGRLLSHLTADVSEDNIKKNQLINILRANRNSIVVIDSDKEYKADPINDTKKRIQEELKEINGFCWITKGREIENYLPFSIFEDFLEVKIDDNQEFNKYDSINDFLERIVPGEGKRFLRSKVRFAEKIIPFLNYQNSMDIFDLNDRMNDVIDKIEMWNSIKKINFE